MPVLRLLLHERYGPTYVFNSFFSGAERLNNLEEKYDDSNLLTLLCKTLVICEELAEEGG